MDLVEEVYAIALKLPKHESFGLISQIQRASVSIPSNIAEGSKRSSRVDFRQFCKIAMGSAAELETQLIIVKRIYPSIPVDNALERLTEVQKMLSRLINKLQIPTEPKNYKLIT